MNAASKISAAGVLGGGGGSVWIQAKEVYSDFSAGSVVSVAGSAYPGIPGKFSPLRGVALFFMFSFLFLRKIFLYFVTSMRLRRKDSYLYRKQLDSRFVSSQ